MQVNATFHIRRYWFLATTPSHVLKELNYKQRIQSTGLPMFYVDINYYGESDRDITIMELKYGEYVHQREMITYRVEGDDGL